MDILEESTLDLKQDNLFYEWNHETDKLEILWVLETEDGKFYQKRKSLNIRKIIPDDRYFGR